jgi:hypothetical protein
LDFRDRGVRYRAYLNLRDTRDGRREAERIKRRVEAEIRATILVAVESERPKVQGRESSEVAKGKGRRTA